MTTLLAPSAGAAAEDAADEAAGAEPALAPVWPQPDRTSRAALRAIIAVCVLFFMTHFPFGSCFYQKKTL